MTNNLSFRGSAQPGEPLVRILRGPNYAPKAALISGVFRALSRARSPGGRITSER